MTSGFTTTSPRGLSPAPWELQARFYRRANRSAMRRRVYWERQVPMPDPTLPPELGDGIPE
jgi:hypothetical protein